MSDQRKDHRIIDFDPAKHLSKLRGRDGAEYLEVKWRIVWFRSMYPNGQIITTLEKFDGQTAVVRAEIIAIGDGGETLGSATGYGMEDRGGFHDFLPKAETAAVGRALAALGFGTSFADDFSDADNISDGPVQRNSGWKSRPEDSNGQDQRGGGGYRQSSQVATGERGMSNPNGEPTQGQMRTINTMAEERGISHQQLDQMVMEMTGNQAGFGTMNRGQASQLFDELKKIPNPSR